MLIIRNEIVTCGGILPVMVPISLDRSVTHVAGDSPTATGHDTAAAGAKIGRVHAHGVVPAAAAACLRRPSGPRPRRRA
jgi:hypothetical protein